MKTLLLLWSKRFAIYGARNVTLLAYLSMSSMVLLWIRHNRAPQSHVVPHRVCRENPDFSLVMSMEEMEQAMVMRNWPILRGYEKIGATPQDSPPDPMLLDRIYLNQKVIRNPKFFLRDVMEAEPWQFGRIIHQIWRDDELPEDVVAYSRKWLKLNPDWTYMLWTDASAREFVAEKYPSLLSVYDGWTLPVQKADLLRIVVLYAFGGVYADLDMEPLKPLEPIRSWSSCILSREPDMHTHVVAKYPIGWSTNYTIASNAFMACRKGHPFLHYLLTRIIKYSPMLTGTKCSDTAVCTGTVMLSLSLSFYRRSLGSDHLRRNVALDVITAEPVLFQPTFDNSLIKIYRQCRRTNLTKLQSSLCQQWKDNDYKNLPSSESFTNHHWARTHILKYRKRRFQPTNVKEVETMETDAEFWRPLIWSMNKLHFSATYSL